MAIDTAERFDIRSLNAIPLSTLARDAAEDSELLPHVLQRVEDLLIRVKRELDDPLTAGAFLREQALHWYRHSEADAAWTTRMPTEWGGTFADSRVIGGRLQPWVNARLWTLREELFQIAPWRVRVGKGRARTKVIEGASSRTVHQIIQAEVAQAVLDDMATHPRTAAGVPLVHLSELAARRQVPTINEALSVLFGSPEIGPFVILHPNRYPDCDELSIRAPAGNAVGAALAYTLVQRPASRHGPAASHRGSEPGAAGSDFAAEPVAEGGSVEDVNVWEDPNATEAFWRQVVDLFRSNRQRLPSPPKDFRSRPTYSKLQELVLTDDAFRTGFLAVCWRGRPSGLGLLATLIAQGSLEPEVSTDYEYLEAELGEAAGLDPRKRTGLVEWAVRGWKIVRQGNPGHGLKYLATRLPAEGHRK